MAFHESHPFSRPWWEETSCSVRIAVQKICRTWHLMSQFPLTPVAMLFLDLGWQSVNATLSNWGLDCLYKWPLGWLITAAAPPPAASSAHCLHDLGENKAPLNTSATFTFGVAVEGTGIYHDLHPQGFTARSYITLIRILWEVIPLTLPLKEVQCRHVGGQNKSHLLSPLIHLKSPRFMLEEVLEEVL